MGDAKDFVLKKFNVSERSRLQQATDRVTKCLESLILDGSDKAMSVFNRSAESYEQSLKEENDPRLLKMREERKNYWLQIQAEKQRKKDDNVPNGNE